MLLGQVIGYRCRAHRIRYPDEWMRTYLDRTREQDLDTVTEYFSHLVMALVQERPSYLIDAAQILELLKERTYRSHWIGGRSNSF